MHKLLILILFLSAHVTFCQFNIQSYAEYDKDFGEAAAQKRIESSLLQVDATNINRPGSYDILSYRLGKALFENSNDFLLSDERANIYCYLELNEEASPVLFLYKAFVSYFANNQITNETLALSDSEVRKFDQIIHKVVNEIDFENMRAPYIGFPILLNQSGYKSESKDYRLYLESLPDTSSKINLSGYQLKSVPEEVYNFKNLKNLNLSDNLLEEIPSKLWKIKTLNELELSKNKLNNSSFHVKRNKALKSLNVQFNYISQTPVKVQKLKGLQLLFLGNNFMTDFESQRLKKMKSLKVLNLYNATLHTLPERLAKLSGLEELDLYHNHFKLVDFDFSALPELKTLAFSHNYLWKLPESISSLAHLEKLYAHHNKLDRLPELPGSVKLLDVGYNDFMKVPESITKLSRLQETDFSNCQLEEVPVQLSLLPNLKKVFIQNNPIERDPKTQEAFYKLVEELRADEVSVR